MNPDIVRYIRENRPIYTREAIRQRLLEAGHAEADIDAAWAAVEADAPSPPAPPAAPPGEPSDAPFTPDQFRAPAAGEPTGDHAAVQAPAAGPRQPRFPVVNSPLFWVTLIGYILGMYIVAPLIGGALTEPRRQRRGRRPDLAAPVARRTGRRHRACAAATSRSRSACSSASRSSSACRSRSASSPSSSSPASASCRLCRECKRVLGAGCWVLGVKAGEKNDGQQLS